MLIRTLFLVTFAVGCNGKGGGDSAPSDEDADGDGFDVGEDCNDSDDRINPAATEVCDDLDTDEDCDSKVDDADDSVDTSTATLTLYADTDGDKYGDEHASQAACDPIEGYVAVGGDCDDTNDAIAPGVEEVCDDTIDDDCDGEAQACGWSGPLDPSDASITLLGPSLGTAIGFDVASAGDMNGDGFGDMAVATWYTGTAYLYLGPLSGSPSADATFVSSTSGDVVGDNVAGIDDQDGDGYDDLLLSAVSYGKSRGRAYVVLGPVTGSHVAEDLAAATFQGDAAYEFMGWYPSAGDVNDDGTVDLMIGAPGASDSNGASYIYFGPVTAGTLGYGDADLWFTGLSSYDFAGGFNAANGDVDGDGVDDMLMCAEYSDLDGADAGAAWLFYGPMSGAHTVDEGDVFVHGADSGAHLGYYGSIGGDLDGDGRDDLVVSGIHPFDGGVGSVWVFSAISVAAAAGDLDVAEADAALTADAAGDNFGYYLDTAGDLNADGRDDLAVGAPNTDSNAGAAWGFYGPVSGALTASTDAAFTVVGTDVDQYVGAATAFVGDVSGDDLDDLAIGALGTPPLGALGAGAVYVYDGM